MGSLESKKVIVEKVSNQMKEAKGIVFADFKGLSVKEVTELRKLLRAEGVQLTVAKNTLVGLSAKNAGIEGLDEHLKGTNMWAFAMEEAFAAAKVCNEFAKTHKALVIKGGVMDNAYIDADTVKALANIPSREALLGQICGLFQAPIAALARAIDAVAKQKETEPAA